MESGALKLEVELELCHSPITLMKWKWMGPASTSSTGSSLAEELREDKRRSDGQCKTREDGFKPSNVISSVK